MDHSQFLMKKISGKLILIDDKPYEKELLKEALNKLDVDIEIEYFMNGSDALDYLKHTKDHIFIIISDMNMPKMDGLELKKAIDSDPRLKRKAIPFVFQSSVIHNSRVDEAYDLGVQGYFEKPPNAEAMAKQIDRILGYWAICRHPNNVDQLADHLKNIYY
jgi:CheY-like chemotaxis protein